MFIQLKYVKRHQVFCWLNFTKIPNTLIYTILRCIKFFSSEVKSSILNERFSIFYWTQNTVRGTTRTATRPTFRTSSAVTWPSWNRIEYCRAQSRKPNNNSIDGLFDIVRFDTCDIKHKSWKWNKIVLIKQW